MLKKTKKVFDGGKSKKKETQVPPPAPVTTKPVEAIPAPEPVIEAAEPAPQPALAPEPVIKAAVPAPQPAPAPIPVPVPVPVPVVPQASAPAPVQPPKAKIHPPPAPAPVPVPTPPVRRSVASAPIKSAAVVTSQGAADSDKISTTVPGGIPIPEYPVARSTLPKEEHFSSETPLLFIKDLADLAPAGLFGSLLGDVRDISSYQMDEPFLQALQAEDQKKKAMRNGSVKHELQESLAQELMKHQKDKYGPKGVTCYRDFQWGETANVIHLATHAEMIDGHNSRTGSWTAQWIIQAENTPGVNEAELSGDVHMRVWCYEGCTVHMSGTQTFASTALEGDPDEELPLAKVIVMQIKEWEKEVIEALGAVFEEEMDGTLKAIRRTLPITRTRLKWDLIAQRALKTRQKKK